MLECLSFRSWSSSSASAPVPNLPAPHQERTPNNASSTQSSPGPNVSREFNLAIQADSYNEIRSRIEVLDPNGIDSHVINGCDDDDQDSHQQLLSQVLLPDRECVQEALEQAKPNTLTRLVSAYFDYSETTSRICLHLHRSVRQAHIMYSPLLDLLTILPSDSNHHLNESQCDHAFNVFLKFDSQNNPFPSPDSPDFTNMRTSFSDLKNQLDRSLRKSRTKLTLLRRATAGSAICFIVTAVGVVASAVVVTTHAIAAVATASICSVAAPFPHPKKAKKKELARMAQLEAAAKGTYALNNGLDTIDRLVSLLQTEVEGDKLLVRLCLERGKDRYVIQEVLKQLRRNHEKFLHYLEDLDIHIYICFNFVNKTRSILLNEICHYQSVYFPS